MIRHHSSPHVSRILVTDSDTIRTLTPPEYQKIRSAEEAEERRRQDLLSFLSFLSRIGPLGLGPETDFGPLVEEYMAIHSPSTMPPRG